MIGNDVVDLKQAAIDSNWQRKGYLTKVYHPSEQELILESADPSSMTWLLWTMKEASYKIVNRATGLRSYSPLSFICTELKTDGLEATGKISFGETSYAVKSKISDQLIHSAAVLNQNDFTHLQLSYLPYSKTYVTAYNHSSVRYQISKTSAGLPQLTHMDTGKSHAVSISHHGRFLVIAYSDSPLPEG